MLKSNEKTIKTVEIMEKICYNQEEKRKNGGTNMKKHAFKSIFLIIIFMFVLMLCSQGTFATVEKLNPDEYKTTLETDDASYILKAGGKVVRLLRIVAAVVTVVAITIIGVRYIVGSVDEKAGYKEIMVPLIVGCVFIAALSAILTLIQSIF